MSTALQWWTQPYQVERECTCAKHARGSECAAYGWHVVDSHPTASEALADAAALNARGRARYRVTERATGRIVHSDRAAESAGRAA